MDETDFKFKYQKITNHFLGQRMHFFKYVCAVFALILLVMVVLEGRPFEYEIKSYVAIFILLSFSVIMHFFLKPYDSICLTDKHLVIKKYATRAVKFRLYDIKSFSSTTNLRLEFNSGKTETIDYSRWLLPMTKVRELTKLLNEEIDSRKSSELEII